MEKEIAVTEAAVNHSAAEKETNKPIVNSKPIINEGSSQRNLGSTPAKLEEANKVNARIGEQEKKISEDNSILHSSAVKSQVDTSNEQEKESSLGESTSSYSLAKKNEIDRPAFDQVLSPGELNGQESPKPEMSNLNEKKADCVKGDLKSLRESNKNLDEALYEEEAEPVFDGTEEPGMGVNRSLSARSVHRDLEAHGSVWPEKAVALTNFVRSKSTVAVSTVLRRLSGKSDDGKDVTDEEDKSKCNENNAAASQEHEMQAVSQKTAERPGWNPLSLIGILRDDNGNRTKEKNEMSQEAVLPIAMKGRIILYTGLGCQESREVRLFLHRKRLRYVEVNIDVYPSRKMELEKIAGDSAVPRVFFNEVLIGGWSELKSLDESGKLMEKIEYVVDEAPSFEAPLPPLSGEDDLSSSGSMDELAIIVKKMKQYIVVKDRFYKLRRFTNCFLGSEAVDFLSEDQYLEREEAVEFGRKLASNLFFQHVLDENVFEDGNHLYRFLDDDPFVSQCQNIPRGLTEVKPKPIIEISSRLRFLSHAIFEAYASEDGRHIDYRSIHGSEEFARYLRITEELQRVNLKDMPREEKLAFFINLYNMMAIHAILVWGHPSGPMERRKLFGEFKYVIGGCTYSLSAIQNGILRSNQRPPYNLIKPFGAKDKRLKVVLPYPEPLIHFALVSGTRSGPALRCYSPGNIDKELVEAAHDFLRFGGLIVDLTTKVAYVSKILRWFSVDFGKNEVEVLKHAANYLESSESQALLELLASSQLKVVYQPYDWGLNH
ncbi:PREDICTED: uncharacterized protein LOC109232432 [Nicotiana attenuata]|uniref:DEP domain-containing protein n=1 Tax=Nicotiana attenuata TaxID=49451 RepID=A0A1J6IMP2_NICAT|nr:PREDICTED: uncharacterized protein LOC109232432 [Nicotiana attenuata]XP_019253739.1 PREDICTED: uncharacterized protein LOC109232432 [Nicotiana attenuata]OIS98966.1 hypothetical protein A4A49_29310 [Nicotiana attenuata]